ncbi:MAG: phosphomannomutase/phosphoglucomutase, partial [Candidatus Magasanikbacteria bacterium CG_4_10_14_0_2_um_filter_41_10]
MAFPSHIFKAYDIRGIYGTEVTEALAYNIGRAFAEFMKKDQGKDTLTLVVCEDMRVSSPPLKKEVIRGLTEQGIDVVDIGLASTPTFYFGVAKYGYDGGIQITASHNPGQYNGFKMVRPAAGPISGETGIMEIRDMVEKGEFPSVEKTGTVTMRTGVIEDEVVYALSQVDISRIKPFTVVVDNANGMGSLVMEKLFAQLPCTLEKMYFELDGNFPNHDANPLIDENNTDIQKRVVETGADLGIALDGDSDRVFFIDNMGETVEPAIVRGMLAQVYLKDHPGGAVGYDVRPGKITEDMILEAGGKPFLTKVGHSLIKEESKKHNAIFSGESSGHFFIKADFGFFEMPALIVLQFLRVISESGKSVREYIEPLMKYAHSGEINFEVEDKTAVFERLKISYGEHLTQ